MNYNKSLFEGVPKKQVNKSRFNLSHEYKAQMLPGQLIPVLTMEMLPQDEITLDSEFMFRFSPLYFPIMQKMTMRCDYYYIPNRILWQESTGNIGWSKWIAEMEEATPPMMKANLDFETLTFSDKVLAYMGLPLLHEEVGVRDNFIDNLNALPLSAYLKIYDEYYRISQLEEEKWFNLQEGDNTAAFNTAFGVVADGGWKTLRANWEKDYFTSALPTPQIGDAVTIPITDENLRTGWVDDSGTPVTGALNAATEPTGEAKTQIGATDVHIEATATIRDLRLAETLQSYYERILKIGQRYRDFIKGLWGTDPTPGFVDVPILLGSKFGRVQIADVMSTTQTAVTGNSAKLADYAGQANLYTNDGGAIKYECREHGWLMAILQVNPNTGYGQGVERFWRRSVQTDYALDMFSGIGDQEILKEEVMYNNKTSELTKNQETFGYIPRHSEYRYKNNVFTGDLIYNAGVSQHLGRIWNPTEVHGAVYDQDIEIGELFVKSGSLLNGGIRLTDVFRILTTNKDVQYPTEGVIYAHIFHSIYMNRALPMFATPKL